MCTAARSNDELAEQLSECFAIPRERLIVARLLLQQGLSICCLPACEHLNLAGRWEVLYRPPTGIPEPAATADIQTQAPQRRAKRARRGFSIFGDGTIVVIADTERESDDSLKFLQGSVHETGAGAVLNVRR